MTTAARNRRVQELTDTQSWELLEERAQRRLCIGAKEFIRRWQAGAYGDADDNPDALELAMLLPIVGIDPWANGNHTTS